MTNRNTSINLMDIAEEVQDMMTDGAFDYLNKKGTVEKIVADFADVNISKKEAKEILELIDFRG